MGNCVYCGNPAGFLKNFHKDCKEKRDEERKIEEEKLAEEQRLKEEKQRVEQNIIKEVSLQIQQIASNAHATSNIQDAVSKIFEIAKDSPLSKAMVMNTAREGWEIAIEKAFSDGLLSTSESDNLLHFITEIGYPPQSLTSDPGFMRIQKGRILKSITEDGIVPEYIQFDGLRINLQKGERVAWAFQNVKYYEQKEYKHYEGGSSGVSIRVMKGVYYRTSSFKGYPVTNTKTELRDTGILTFTNRYIHFSGQNKDLRIKLDKIVNYRPFSDGIGIQRDAQTAKPQLFIFDNNVDGWFAYNLATNLGRL